MWNLEKVRFVLCRRREVNVFPVVNTPRWPQQAAQARLQRRWIITSPIRVRISAQTTVSATGLKVSTTNMSMTMTRRCRRHTQPATTSCSAFALLLSTTSIRLLNLLRVLKCFFLLLPVLPVEKSIRMTEERDKWRKYVRGVANRRIEDG